MKQILKFAFACVVLLFAYTVKGEEVRNLALFRAAYHSSAVNYDNTAHLVTDGLMAIHENAIIRSQYDDSPSGEDMGKAFDGTTRTKFLSFHSTGWAQYEFKGGESFVINKYTLSSGNDSPTRDPKDWTFQGSNNGKDWTTLDTQTGVDFPQRFQTHSFPIPNTKAYKMYRLHVTANHGDNRLQFSEIGLYENETSKVTPPVFSSKWISKAGGNQWIYIDLGANCQIGTVKLYWDDAYATSYKIETSSDRSSWTQAYSTASGKGGTEVVGVNAVARYVRLSATEGANPDRYSLIEMEVYGTGGPAITPKPQPAPLTDGTLFLTGGNWKLQRAESVKENGIQLSKAGYDDSNWIPATVPGTVLTSYLNNGAIPDPDFADQQLQISDAYFTTDFWYRNTFTIPSNYQGKRVWLNFDGINWKADVYVNGTNVGDIQGAFIRGKFDITPLVAPGKPAHLAIFIHKNATPGGVTLQSYTGGAGGNGGALGADNPTIHASVGWDWMPTVRGRNTGIQDDVFLSVTEDVSVVDPFIVTDALADDFSSADLKLSLDVKNHSASAQTGLLKGVIQPGNITFQQNVNLNPSESKTVSLDKNNIPVLKINKPSLWWPNGYGDQFMYELTLSFETNGKVSDLQVIPFGIRKVSWKIDAEALAISVNGTRIFMRGGNWGMSESMLRLDKEGYDHRVRLHKEENFTMIRNWVGMTGDDHFYQACDKYGVLVWDDFWLANPGDGPNPDDPDMFMKNADDKIKRVRNHPSVVLYCGRNEGDPPATLFDKLVASTSRLDGTRPYVPHSAANEVSGFGPYTVQNPVWYFRNRAGKKLHSEMGMPNVPSVETMKAMLPKESFWPIDDMWGIHDFCMNSAQDATKYIAAMNKYGTATSLEDFCRKAQMVNMENHKAMFEAYAGAQGNGLLMWMSQSAWPSTVWQTYDFYLEPTAGFFGCKKACEPLHILWDANSNKVKVSNNTTANYSGLTAEARIYNMNGSLQYTNKSALNIDSDQVQDCFTVAYPENLSDVHFIKLELKRGAEVLSENFYWRGKVYQEYSDLANMKKVTLQSSVTQSNVNDTITLTAKIANPSSDVALMIRLKPVKDQSRERILPVFYSDNYFSLLPGESKVVTLEFDRKYLGGESPFVVMEGWNIVSND